MELPEGKRIILFDGVCNLCNRSVQWLLERDRSDRFRFAPLQGETGRILTAQRGIDTREVDSILLIDPGTAYYIKSDAALEIARQLSGYRWIPRLLGWIPRSLRDAVYDLIARNRYRWFGHKTHCMVPSPEVAGKFLP
ncbi:DCC1-like thiol-disulfide oxidoreductase family protein [Robiginitalea sp. M366]|uniref:thiol-disulfide oxidoreductase DCC family protein n=1 Tax=Robiginitalea aestuariiviva TaxID=3036903 RepID=UPI00240DD2AF|nr:DCC1-like thiol-disulfide oxidoreductase family protein [Robiginitalea aestuariiviva]MDG1572882.1 DCC1-like thiol-disulfide oxidoreductase family protein [Robiginitalea aestuariiviva]